MSCLARLILDISKDFIVLSPFLHLLKCSLCPNIVFTYVLNLNLSGIEGSFERLFLKAFKVEAFTVFEFSLFQEFKHLELKNELREP